MKLKNQVAIVTGAARGIGRKIALRFATEGAWVVIADVDQEEARRGAAEISSTGAKAMTVAVDMINPSQVTSLIKETVRQWERLGCLVKEFEIELGTRGIQAEHLPSAHGKQQSVRGRTNLSHGLNGNASSAEPSPAKENVPASRRTTPLTCLRVFEEGSSSVNLRSSGRRPKPKTEDEAGSSTLMLSQ